MLLLESESEAAAEALRDAMDPVWYSLSTEERRLLDLRETAVITSIEGIRSPVAGAVVRRPPVKANAAFPMGPIRNWRKAS